MKHKAILGSLIKDTSINKTQLFAIYIKPTSSCWLWSVSLSCSWASLAHSLPNFCVFSSFEIFMVFEIFVAGGQDSKDWSWCAATVGKQHSWTNSTHQRSSFPGFFSHLETISLQTGMTAHQSFWSLVSIAGQAFAAAERERLRERPTIFNSDGGENTEMDRKGDCETLREHLIWHDLYGLHFFWRTWFHYRLVV